MSLNCVYTIQPVVQRVVQLVVQRVVQRVASCKHGKSIIHEAVPQTVAQYAESYVTVRRLIMKVSIAFLKV